MMALRLFFCLLFLLLSFSSVWAQVHPAEQAYTQATVALRNKAYSKALTLFQMAATLAPKSPKWARFRHNMLYYEGLCHARIGGWDHLRKAASKLARFLHQRKNYPSTLALKRRVKVAQRTRSRLLLSLVQGAYKKAQSAYKNRQDQQVLLLYALAQQWAKECRPPQPLPADWLLLRARTLLRQGGLKRLRKARSLLADYRKTRGTSPQVQRLQQQLNQRLARRHLQRGKERLAQQNYGLALRDFQQARAALRSPSSDQTLWREIAFFLGKCQIQQKHPQAKERAKASLRTSLTPATGRPWEAEARRLLAALPGGLPATSQALHAATKPSSQKKPPPARRPSVWSWVLFGGGGAALVGGVVLTLVAQNSFANSEKAANTPGTPAHKITESFENGQNQQLGAYFCFGGAGAAIAAGLVVLLTTTAPRQTQKK